VIRHDSKKEISAASFIAVEIDETTDVTKERVVGIPTYP